MATKKNILWSWRTCCKKDFTYKIGTDWYLDVRTKIQRERGAKRWMQKAEQKLEAIKHFFCPNKELLARWIEWAENEILAKKLSFTFLLLRQGYSKDKFATPRNNRNCNNSTLCRHPSLSIRIFGTAPIYLKNGPNLASFCLFWFFSHDKYNTNTLNY